MIDNTEAFDCLDENRGNSKFADLYISEARVHCGPLSRLAGNASAARIDVKSIPSLVVDRRKIELFATDRVSRQRTKFGRS